MRIQIIAILIIVSFISPSFHFVGHQHVYNPFTKRLEHQHRNKNSEVNCIVGSDPFSHIDKAEECEKADICEVTLNNTVYKKSYFPRIIKRLHINKYIYISLFIRKNKKINKILFIAPKNSPPYFA